MISLKYVTLLTAGIVALFATGHVAANPQTTDTSTGGFNSGATVGSGSAAGSGCSIILNDPSYKYLLGCARGNVPQNYTDSKQMEDALGVFCADNHKCDEKATVTFLSGLLNSCGKDAATNPKNQAYKMFTDLYTAVPRWQSYCRKDKSKKYCLLQQGTDGKYGPREHSFTCDECGQLRVETYSNWEQRTSNALGKPLAVIDQDYEKFNAKCPTVKAAVDENGGKNNTEAAKEGKSTKSSTSTANTTPVMDSSKFSLLVAVVTLLVWTL